MSGPRLDPAPLFDLVTGFPPDDAVDVTVSMPLSLAVYMTMLESTGRAAELAVLRKIHIEQARETARAIQAGVGELTGSEADVRLRITHIVEERVPRVNGLRPHVHAYVGATCRTSPDDGETPVEPGTLTALADSRLFPQHRDRLAAATTDLAGLAWGPTAWSALEVVGPRWLDERLAQLRHDDLSCRGPWPRPQIVAEPR
ncbi:hypothetical protein LQ327_32890 [Actinomycetospora endophytica]|uniref:DUF222 domain-containing protein n=1 Tax=Actinomycetospora endophytica TaxID=2291215 RepID=A0ABS8PJE1_9PSEU|nr:hypothetical protein [Actinomycetospora endophytica]MCD2198178.1 hypothetical protein [Actinomycetospora endophytica]